MAIDFPASPTLNDVFTVGNVTYVWDGTKWTASVTGGISLDKIEEGNTSAEVIDTGSDGRFVVTTEGTERLRVTNTGLVGMGTNSPSVELSIAGSDPNLVIWEGSDGASSSKVQLGTGLVQGFINIHKGDGTRTVQIGSDDTSYFNGGNVGIGTTSPASILHCASTGDNNIRVVANGATAQFGVDVGVPFVGTNNGPFNFYSNGQIRATLDSSGRLGIGTSSPGALLDINGSGNIVRLGDGTNTIDVRFKGPNNWATQLDTSADKFNIQRNSTPLITLDGAGRFGIGITSPAKKLDVYEGSTGNVEQYLRNTTINLLSKIDGTTGAQFGTETSHPLVLLTANSERARIDNSGRLLVGTSTSLHHNAQLQTAGTGYYGYNHFQFSNDAFAPTISVKKSRSASVGGNTIVQDGDRLGTFSFFGADGSTYIQGAGIDAFVDGTPGASDMPSRLVFSTTADGASTPTERMRIASNGIIVARNSVGDTLNLYNAASAGTSNAFIYGAHSSASAYTGTTSFVVWTNGNVVNTNGSYTTISDAKLKENIVSAGSQWNDIKAIQIRNWNFKAETGNETHRQIGPIAQEVEAVCPGLVFEIPDRDQDGNETGEVTKGINQSVLYMKAVKALQEAMARIETLEAKVAALETP
jgi:hypothetical protein